MRRKFSQETGIRLMIFANEEPRILIGMKTRLERSLRANLTQARTKATTEPRRGDLHAAPTLYGPNDS